MNSVKIASIKFQTNISEFNRMFENRMLKRVWTKTA
jgi:hypothetical protein